MTGGAPMLFMNNVIATRAILAMIPGSAVKRFVLVSSLGVYGAGQLKKGATLDETTPLDPAPHRRDPYTYSKVAQERVAWQARETLGVPLVVIRPGVIYGPGRGAMSSRVGLRVGKLLLRMGGRQHVPYTYVDNCAAAIAAAVTAQGVEGQAFNIIDDDLPTAKHVLKHHRRSVERLHVLPVPHWAIGAASGLCEWYHRWSRGQLPAVLTRYKSAAQWGRLRYSNGKAKAVLGWRPAISFDEGLRLSASCA
jgi:nucleoside-diphosphate-sugar epimerase